MLEEKEPLEYQDGTGDEFGKVLRELDQEENPSEKKDEEDVNEDIEEEEPLGSNLIAKEDFVLRVFKKLLKAWNRELVERTEIQKKSAQGKIETATYKQCKKHIKTAFKLLHTRQLPDDLLNPIYDIAQSLENREYVKAHDSYLRMAIGNAPWPMGVTMVGIHERSAREKIHSNQIAHVLNDETQRKYIQAFKRIMTFCQRKYPTDPSKTVG